MKIKGVLTSREVERKVNGVPMDYIKGFSLSQNFVHLKTWYEYENTLKELVGNTYYGNSNV